MQINHVRNRKTLTPDELTEAELGRARDQVRGAVAELAEFYDDDPSQAMVRVCKHDCHLVVAWRWEVWCPSCGQGPLDPTPGTHVRLGSVDDGRLRCFEGFHQYRCGGCGASVLPTERIYCLYGEAFESWLSGWLAHYRGTLFPEEAHDLAEDIIGNQLVYLGEDCNREARADRDVWYCTLRRQLNRAWCRLQAGASEEDVVDGDDYSPGIVRDDHGDLQAWAQAADGDVIIVELDDMDLVGVPEASRVTGLSEGTIKSYVHRGYMPAPEPVAGNTALVWRRETIQQWLRRRELVEGGYAG
jgi:predicted DNA-binding transcriptional regulator AlpA